MIVLNHILDKKYLKKLLEERQELDELNFEQFLPNQKMIDDLNIAITNNKNLSPHIQKSFYDYLKNGFSLYKQAISIINQYKH